MRLITKLKNQSEFTQSISRWRERGWYSHGGRSGCAWYDDVWVSENLIDVSEIECGGVLRVLLEVWDGHGE